MTSFLLGITALLACEASERAWVMLTLEGLEAPLAEEVASELQTELGQEGVDLCAAEPKRSDAPAATVTVRQTAVDSIEARAETPARAAMTRTIELQKVPSDGRALVVALAIDDLLRSARQPREAPEPPAPLSPAVAPAPPPPRGGFALGATADAYWGNQVRLGGNLGFAYRLTDIFTVMARLGGRGARTTRSVDGSVDAGAFLGGPGVALALVPWRRRLGLDLVGRIDFSAVSFLPHAVGGASASAATHLSVDLRAGLRAHYALNPEVRLFYEGTVGGAVYGHSATDGGQTITGASGPTIAIGIGLEWWPIR